MGGADLHPNLHPVVGEVPEPDAVGADGLGRPSGDHQCAAVVRADRAVLGVHAEQVEVGPTEIHRLGPEPLQEVEHVGLRLLPLLAVEAGGRERGEVR